MKVTSIVILLLFICQFQSQAQAKNAIYVNAGSLLIFNTTSLNYERSFNHKEKNRLIDYCAVRAGLGLVAGMVSNGPNFELNFVGLTGQKNHHLEMNLGVMVLYDSSSYDLEMSTAEQLNEEPPKKTDFIGPFPMAAVGYRFQKSENGILFRIGLGFPTGLYIGLGYRF